MLYETEKQHLERYYKLESHSVSSEAHSKRARGKLYYLQKLNFSFQILVEHRNQFQTTYGISNLRDLQYLTEQNPDQPAVTLFAVSGLILASFRYNFQQNTVIKKLCTAAQW